MNTYLIVMIICAVVFLTALMFNRGSGGAVALGILSGAVFLITSFASLIEVKETKLIEVPAKYTKAFDCVTVVYKYENITQSVTFYDAKTYNSINDNTKYYVEEYYNSWGSKSGSYLRIKFPD